MSIQLTPKEAELLEFYGKLAEDSINPSKFESIGMRMEHWAKKTPNKVGLLFKDKSLTWKSINDNANKISNYFNNLGLQPGETVAMMMEKYNIFILNSFI